MSLNNCCIARQIERWLRSQKKISQVFSDDQGRSWNVETLLESADKDIETVSVESLWQAAAHEMPWGEQMQHNLESSLAMIATQGYLDRRVDILIQNAAQHNSLEAHLSRITLLVLACRLNIYIPPLLLSPDGVLLDGYHRLAAYQQLNLHSVQAFRLRNLK